MLTGKVIVVTGATRGLGRAMARAALAHGAIVGVGHRGDPEAGASAIRALGDGAGEARLLRLDVTDEASVRAAVKEAASWHGRIDGWVNSAAVNHPGLLVTADDAGIAAMIETNLLGVVRCARAVLPVMMRARTGVLLNVSSVAATRPTRGQSVYAATKGAVESLTRALAVEYAGKGVRVLCLRPGPVDTDMLAGTRAIAEAELIARIPLGRVATPAEVAEHAAFLLSDRAAFATGTVHVVDGGYGVS